MATTIELDLIEAARCLAREADYACDQGIPCGGARLRKTVADFYQAYHLYAGERDTDTGVTGRWAWRWAPGRDPRL